MYIIIGLGNPGEKYKSTRHNVGFMVVDEIVKRLNWQWHNWQKHQAIESYPPKFKHLLVKPQTFMNKSGETIRALQKGYPSRLETFLKRLVVIHDDLDLPLGTIRIRQGGSSAGHHGLESIIQSLGTERFWRIRVGIGRPNHELGEWGVSDVLPDHGRSGLKQPENERPRANARGFPHPDFNRGSAFLLKPSSPIGSGSSASNDKMVEEFVLSPFDKSEWPMAKRLISQAAQLIVDRVAGGGLAMETIHVN